MATKMTKRDWYNTLTTIVENSTYEDKAGALEFIAHEVDLLNRKTSKAGPTKTQIQNAEVIEQIRNALTVIDHPVTISELQAAAPELANYSNQKISALLRQMIPDTVTKTVDKKKSYFSIA